MFNLKGRVILYLVVVFIALQVGPAINGINQSLKTLDKRIELSTVLKGLRGELAE